MIWKKVEKKNRSSELDLLRFLAVVSVFFAHYTDTFNEVYDIVPENHKYQHISRYGSIALIIFFMVSGYVITMNSMKRGLTDFVITRLSRLYPLFWISCFVAFLLPRLLEAHSYLSYTSVKALVANLTMVPMAFGYPLMNPVFHTLVIELFFYFFIGIIIGFKLWGKIISIITIISTLCVVNLFFPTFPIYIGCTPFIAGILFYLISTNHPSELKLKILLLVNFIFALFGAKHLYNVFDAANEGNSPISIWPIIIVITICYIFFFLISKRKFSIKSRMMFKVLGEIAYPFYLFHIYFLCFYWYFSDKIQGDLLLIIIFVMCLVSSWFLNIFVEKPLSKSLSLVLYSFVKVIRTKSKHRDDL